MGAMPALTRRRSKDAHAESWQIFYGDVQVGTIGIRAGVPADELRVLSLREELNTRWTCVFDACGVSSAQEIPLFLPFSRPRQALGCSIRSICWERRGHDYDKASSDCGRRG
jgi:hypothetical protein